MPKKKQNVGEDLQTWVIRDVDKTTRTVITLYASMRGLTVAQALKELVADGFRSHRRELAEWILQHITVKVPPEMESAYFGGSFADAFKKSFEESIEDVLMIMGLAANMKTPQKKEQDKEE